MLEQLSMSLDIAASIVTYRCDLDKLDGAIESFLAQNINASLTIVDNDSGEDYRARLREICGVQLLLAPRNGGYGYGHNLGIHAAAKHRYYLVMNPDVIVHDGALKIMIDYMDARPDVALLVPRVMHPNGQLQPLNKRLPNVFDFFARRFLPRRLRSLRWVAKRQRIYEMRDVGYSSQTEVPFPSGCFMLFRAEALAKIGGFDERFFMYLEDCDIGRRIAQHGKIMYLPDAAITHYWTRGAHHSKKLTWQFIRSMVLYFNKWGWKWL